MCIVLTVLSLAIAATLPAVAVRIADTSALYTSTATRQVDTIRAGSWGAATQGACTGTYDFSVSTRSLDFEASLRSNTIVYIDSPGTFDLKHYTHLCLVITVWDFTLVDLDVTVLLDFLIPTGWLCFPIPLLSTCGSVGTGSGGSHHHLGFMALAGPATPALSFGQRVQADIAAGRVTGFSVRPDSAASGAPASTPATETTAAAPPVRSGTGATAGVRTSSDGPSVAAVTTTTPTTTAPRTTAAQPTPAAAPPPATDGATSTAPAPDIPTGSTP